MSEQKAFSTPGCPNFTQKIYDNPNQNYANHSHIKTGYTPIIQTSGVCPPGVKDSARGSELTPDEEEEEEEEVSKSIFKLVVI